MISYKWQITQTERQTKNGFVTLVHYAVFAEDEKYKASIYGSVQYEQNGSDAFVSYEDLTHEGVTGWVQTSLGKNAVEASLLLDIEKQKNPDVSNGLPWKLTGLPWITTTTGKGN
jgi:hypothetical protein